MLAAGMSWVDLNFLGRPHAIATAVIRAPGSIALVDPGPTTSIGALEAGLQKQGIAPSDVTHLLLTHIHLDHAGATGTLVRRYPHLKVCVHKRGARHMADPTRLVESATRIYGADMDRLWGEVVAVPPENLIALEGGEQISVGGRTLGVAYTPGHASHHVSYFDASSRVAFVGDTAGVCIDGGYILPPTPAPDIDLELWRQSVDRIERWQPSTIFLTHFGPVDDVRPHLRTLLEHLELFAAFVRESLSDSGNDQERSSRFAERVRNELRRQMPEERIAGYKVAAPLELMWYGLARYWRQRTVGPPAP